MGYEGYCSTEQGRAVDFLPYLPYNHSVNTCNGHFMKIFKATFPFLLAAISIGAVVLLPEPALAFSLSMSDGASSARGIDQASTLFGSTGIFTTLTNVMLFIVGAISVIMVVVGGLRYVISGGNSTNITAAKNTILYAVIGLIVAILAYAMINFVIGSLVPGGEYGGTNV